ncbi:MAG: trehalase family glycosidase, partial [Planctomycetota bacterium]
MSTTHTPTGWNTWDFAGFNRLVYLRRGETVVTVEFAVWDEAVPARVPPPDPEHRKIGKLYSQFRWEDVVRLGPHAPLGLPSRLEFRAGEVRYTAEATERDGTLDLQVRPDRATAQRVVFRLLTPVGAALVRKTATRGTFAGCEIRLRGATWPTKYFVNIAEPYAVGAAGRPAAIRVRPAGARAGAAPGTFAALERQALAGEGALADAPGAMMQAICWNTLFDTRRRLVSSPVSRDWCSDWRGVLVFCWDTYLVATFMSYEAPELSRLNIEAVTAAIAELGFVPNYYMAHGAASRDRSMPPLGTYLVWKLFVAANGLATARSTHGVAARGRGHSRKPRKTVFDRAWLASLYPLFVRWHGYWLKNRAGAGTGLLSWGSNPVHYEFPQLVPYNQILQHTRQSAMYESGLDNSPLFDEAAFDAERNCLTLEDVMLSSLYAMDCEALAHMAAHLGRRQDAARLRREYGRIAELINERLWDEHHGLYVNRHWPNAEGPLAGRYSSRWAPTSFFPMIAGVATPARAARMVREHLLNPQEFWGTW